MLNLNLPHMQQQFQHQVMNGFLHFVEPTGLWLCIIISMVESAIITAILGMCNKQMVYLYFIIFQDQHVSLCLLLTNAIWSYQLPFNFLMLGLQFFFILINFYTSLLTCQKMGTLHTLDIQSLKQRMMFPAKPSLLDHLGNTAPHTTCMEPHRG